MRRRLNDTERKEREAQARLANEAHRQHQAVKRTRGGARTLLPIKDGCAFVISDQHYYPGLPPSVAHRASIVLANRLRPYAVISNGDAIDGASISRWPVASFVEMEERPTVAAELKVTAKRLADYERLPFVEWLVWNLGNHDARFETRLAEHAPEFAGVNGFTLKEHFPGWLPAWRTDFVAKPDATPEVIVKHRFRGGEYSAANNTKLAGTSIVTGHDHALWAKAFTDIRGTRWGIDAGTMAPIDSPHFTHYTEDNVVNWQSGFVILHFRSGRFTGPELVHAMPDGRALFRGDELRV
jgi:hypothetical protein